MKRLSRSVLVVPVVLVSMLGVVGCSDDDKAPSQRADPSTASTVDPTDSTSPTADTTPDLTPVQVVRAWVKATNAVQRDGDTTTALALASSDCDTCRNEVVPFAQVYLDGGWIKGGRRTVAGIKRTTATAKRQVIVAAIRIDRGRTKVNAQATPVAFEADHSVLKVTLVRIDGHWMIQRIVHPT